MGNQNQARSFMKRDTQQRPVVGKNAPATAIGDPKPAAMSQKAASPSPATVTVTLSARYIDSRLKQFCCR